MTTLTIRFKGLQEQLLDRLVSVGVAESKSEAIRMGLMSLAYQSHLLDDKTIVNFISKEMSKARRTPEEILADVERAKNELTVR